MSYTALQLANLALRAVGEPSLAGFDDAGSVAGHVNALFPKEFRALLKLDDWYWARKVVELTEDTDLTHYTEWDYAFDLPTDLLQIQNAIDFTGNQIIWELQDNHLMTNDRAYTDSDSNVYPRMWYTADTLTDTVGDGTGYPELVTGYEDLLPDDWANAFVGRLAWRLAKPITREMKLSKDLRDEYLAIHLPEAKRVNATATPGYGPPTDDWSAVPTS